MCIKERAQSRSLEAAHRLPGILLIHVRFRAQQKLHARQHVVRVRFLAPRQKLDERSLHQKALSTTKGGEG